MSEKESLQEQNAKERALRILETIASDPKAPANARIRAAKALLEELRHDENCFEMPDMPFES